MKDVYKADRHLLTFDTECFVLIFIHNIHPKVGLLR